MKTIGILGGFGPQATMDFEARIHKVSQQLIPQRMITGYPPVITWFCRHPPLLLNTDSTPVIPRQPDPRLIEAARKLGPLTDVIVIPSNTPHLFQAAIEKASGNPVLSIIREVLAEVDVRRWQTVGVVGFGDPVFYTAPLTEKGLESITLEHRAALKLDVAIRKVMEGRDDQGSVKAAEDAVNQLREKGADGVVLGCTEVPLLLKDRLPDDYLINPAQLLAEAVVRYVVESQNVKG